MCIVQYRDQWEMQTNAEQYKIKKKKEKRGKFQLNKYIKHAMIEALLLNCYTAPWQPLA